MKMGNRRETVIFYTSTVLRAVYLYSVLLLSSYYDF
jgi:hypothetical protein